MDFGSHGLWQFMNNRRWVQVNTASPGPIAAGDLDGSYREDAIGWVQGQGVLARYDNVAPWKRLLGAPASRLVACDLDGDDRDDLVVDRGSLGLWVLYGGTRLVKLSPETSRKLICANLDGDGRDDGRKPRVRRPMGFLQQRDMDEAADGLPFLHGRRRSRR